MLSFNFSAKCRRVLRKRHNWFIILIIVFIIYLYLSTIYSVNDKNRSSALTSTSGADTEVESQLETNYNKNSGVGVPREAELSSVVRPAAEIPYQDVSKGNFRMAYFWIGDGLKNFLVKGFDVNAHEGLAFVCVGLASSAILYEGLRTLRDSYLNKFVDKQKANRALENRKRISQRLKTGTRREGSPAAGPSTDYGGGGDTGDASISLMRAPLEEEDDYELSAKSGSTFAARFAGQTERQEKFRIFLNLILSTFLHMIYILLGYVLMLAVMTFNVWILIAIAVGIGVGQFIFGVYRRTDIVLSHHSDNIITSRKSSSDFCEEEFSSPSTATLDTSGDTSGQKRDSGSVLVSQSQSETHLNGQNSDSSGLKNQRGQPARSRSDCSNSSDQLTTEIIVHSNTQSKASPSDFNVTS